MQGEIKTPWQRVFEKFGLKQSELARELGLNRSQISKRLSGEVGGGLIDGEHQVLLMAAAKRRGVKLAPSDLLPVVR